MAKRDWRMVAVLGILLVAAVAAIHFTSFNANVIRGAINSETRTVELLEADLGMGEKTLAMNPVNGTVSSDSVAVETTDVVAVEEKPPIVEKPVVVSPPTPAHGTAFFIKWNENPACNGQAMVESFLNEYSSFSIDPVELEEVTAGEEPLSAVFEDTHSLILTSNHTITSEEMQNAAAYLSLAFPECANKKLPSVGKVITADGMPAPTTAYFADDEDDDWFEYDEATDVAQIDALKGIGSFYDPAATLYAYLYLESIGKPAAKGTKVCLIDTGVDYEKRTKFSVNESFKMKGTGNLQGKTLTITLTSVVASGANGAFKATFTIKNGSTILGTVTTSENTFLPFNAQPATNVINGNVFVGTIGVTTGNKGFVLLSAGTKGAQSVYDGIFKNQVYLQEPDDVYNESEPHGNIDDTIGHGTFLYGLLAGIHPDYPGIAWNADIVAIKASGTVQLAKAIKHCNGQGSEAQDKKAPAVMFTGLTVKNVLCTSTEQCDKKFQGIKDKITKYSKKNLKNGDAPSLFIAPVGNDLTGVKEGINGEPAGNLGVRAPAGLSNVVGVGSAYDKTDTAYHEYHPSIPGLLQSCTDVGANYKKWMCASNCLSTSKPQALGLGPVTGYGAVSVSSGGSFIGPLNPIQLSTLEGTSVSAAEFAGIAALMRTAKNNLTQAEFVNALQVTSTKQKQEEQGVTEISLSGDGFTFAEGESFAVAGANDYAGQTLSVTLDTITFFSAEPSSFRAVFKITNEDGTLIATKSVPIGELIPFNAGTSKKFSDDDVHVQYITYDFPTGNGTVLLGFGGSPKKYLIGEDITLTGAGELAGHAVFVTVSSMKPQVLGGPNHVTFYFTDDEGNFLGAQIISPGSAFVVDDAELTPKVKESVFLQDAYFEDIPLNTENIQLCVGSGTLNGDYMMNWAINHK